VGDIITAPALSIIREYTNTFFRANEPLLNRRRADGHILDCHGDLRLEHIHLTKDCVCIFDCIEFSERLRLIDTANDVAFLAMDFDYQDRPDLASNVVGSIARLISDKDLNDLLDFYKCYRACVRGKVEAMRSREPEVETQERQASRDCAVRHFQLALNYAVTGSVPVILVIMGRIGSGKSTVARLLSDALGWSLESSDHTRKRLALNQSKPVDQSAPRTGQGRDGARQTSLYSETMTTQTYDNLIRSAVERASRRQSTILDATFGNKSRRDRLREKLRADGVRYCFIELTAPEAILKDRLGRRNDAAANASDARLETFGHINAMYEEPDALEDAHHREVNAARAPEATAHEVLRHLAAYK
jgi:predicted kinase